MSVNYLTTGQTMTVAKPINMAYKQSYSKDEVLVYKFPVSANALESIKWVKIDNGVWITYEEFDDKNQKQYKITNFSDGVPPALAPEVGARLKGWYSNLHSTGVCNSHNFLKVDYPTEAAVVKSVDTLNNTTFVPAKEVFQPFAEIPFVFAVDEKLKDPEVYKTMDYVYIYEQFAERGCHPGQYFINRRSQELFDMMCVMPSSLRISPEFSPGGEYSILFEVSSTTSVPLIVYESAFLKISDNTLGERMTMRTGPISLNMAIPRR